MGLSNDPFQRQLLERSASVGNILSMGIDPVLERIPLQGETEEVITRFAMDLIDAMVSEDVVPAFFKPNSAYFEQYGLPGLRALQTINQYAKEQGIPVCLDAKRADIGKSSAAYATAAYEQFGADMVTVHPYLGIDGVDPFLQPGKGTYVLVRNSNPSAKELQDLSVGGQPLFEKTAQMIQGWEKSGVGGVVGATYPAELQQVLEVFTSQGQDFPLLIPGVGAQGGSVNEVLKVIKSAGSQLGLHRINSTSGICYAWEKEQTDDYAGAAVKEIKRLLTTLSL